MIFKRNITKLFRPEKKPLRIKYHNGTRWIFQLRVGLSPLKNHKKSHNFEDTPDDLCLCMLTTKTTGHFILNCPNFNEQRNELFCAANPILLANNIHPPNDSEMVHLFVYGDEKLKFYENQNYKQL